MANASGLIGGVLNISKSASGSFNAQVVVSGGVTSDFDAQVVAYRNISPIGQFDAKVAVVIQAAAVAPSALIQLPLAADTSGLPPFSVYFSGMGYASGDKTIIGYRWYFNDMYTTISGGQATNHTFNQSGSYLVTLQVTDSDGLCGYDIIRINTYSGVALSLPELQISGVPQSGNVPLAINFGASGGAVVGTSLMGYTWNFSHGIHSIRQNPSGITFQTPGKYIPVCTIVDSRGVIMSDSLVIGVNN